MPRRAPLTAARTDEYECRTCTPGAKSTSVRPKALATAHLGSGRDPDEAGIGGIPIAPLPAARRVQSGLRLRAMMFSPDPSAKGLAGSGKVQQLAVVQWIEQGPPKTQMQVRFLPAGLPRRSQGVHRGRCDSLFRNLLRRNAASETPGCTITLPRATSPALSCDIRRPCSPRTHASSQATADAQKSRARSA